MMMYSEKLLAVLFVLIVFTACKPHSVQPEVACEQPAQVSFSNDIVPLFTASCSLSGCHSGNSPSGNLNLEPAKAYAQLMKPGSGYIDTINPRFSVLHAQMNSVSNPMPPTGKLDQCKLDLVLKWIEQKAPNN